MKTCAAVAAAALLTAQVVAFSPLVPVGPTSARTPPGQALAITSVNVLPMDRDTVLEDRTVLIRDGRIVAVTPTDSTQLPDGVRVLAGRHRYLLPGLVDFHVHLRAESELSTYLDYGVTTIVNMRGFPAHLETRAALRSGRLVGPRLFTAGPLIDGDPPIRGGSGTRVLSEPDSAEAVVRTHLDAGYDFVKIYNNLDPEIVDALVPVAHAAGLAVVGHLPRRPVRRQGLRRALAAGLDMIAHGEEVFFTEYGGAPDSLLLAGTYTPPSDDDIRRTAWAIADAGTAVTPNLSFTVMTLRMLEDADGVFTGEDFERLDPDVREMWRAQNPSNRRNPELFAMRERFNYRVVQELTAALRDAGALLLAGTDASSPGLYPGRSLHLEVDELMRAGLTPYEALSTATRNAGRFLGKHVPDAPPLGLVKTGFAADLLIIDGDPRTDPAALRAPALVLKGGEVIAGTEAEGVRS